MDLRAHRVSETGLQKDKKSNVNNAENARFEYVQQQKSRDACKLVFIKAYAPPVWWTNKNALYHLHIY